jgi:SHS2 domain-containing protein
MLNIEHKLMQQVSPSTSYELLTHAQKLEVFEHALVQSNGDDLAKILWLDLNFDIYYYSTTYWLIHTYYTGTAVRLVRRGYSVALTTLGHWQ